MENNQIHISNIAMMQLLQKVASHDSFKSKLQRKLIKKKSIIEATHHQHLLNCEKCMSELWETYLSLNILLGTKKMNIIPKLQLKLDSLQHFFQSQHKDGFLLLNNFTPIPAVRSNEEASFRCLTYVNYLLLVPLLKNLPVHLEISLSANGLKFDVCLEKNTENNTFIFLFYYNNHCIESHSISNINEKAKFFLNYDDAMNKKMYSFIIQKKGDSTSHNFLNFTL